MLLETLLAFGTAFPVEIHIQHPDHIIDEIVQDVDRRYERDIQDYYNGDRSERPQEPGGYDDRHNEPCTYA